MSDFIDDDTLLPKWPFTRFDHQLTIASFYFYVYDAAHQLLNLHGWHFSDELHDDIGSEENLTLNSTHPGEDGYVFGDDWNDYHQGDELLPTQPDIWAMAKQRAIASFDPGHTFIDDEHLWISAINDPMTSISNKKLRFYIGLTQRILFRFLQHRGAKEIEQLFGLDNRGRPALP